MAQSKSTSTTISGGLIAVGGLLVIFGFMSAWTIVGLGISINGFSLLSFLASADDPIVSVLSPFYWLMPITGVGLLIAGITKAAQSTIPSILNRLGRILISVATIISLLLAFFVFMILADYDPPLTLEFGYWLSIFGYILAIIGKLFIRN